MSTAHGKIDYGELESSTESLQVSIIIALQKVQWERSIRPMTLNSQNEEVKKNEESVCGMYCGGSFFLYQLHFTKWPGSTVLQTALSRLHNVPNQSHHDGIRSNTHPCVLTEISKGTT